MGPLGRLFELVPKYWLRGLLALFSLLVGTGASLVIPYVVKQVIDVSLLTGNLAAINRYVLLIICVALVRGLAALLQTYCTESLAQAVVYDLRNRLYDHLQKISFSYFDKVQTGDLMSRLTSDVETVRMVIGMALVNFLANNTMLIGILIMLFSLDWQLTLVVAAVLPFAIFTVYRFSLKSRVAFRALQVQVAKLTSFLQENISGIRVVKAFGQELAEVERFKRLNDENLARNMGASQLFAFYVPLLNFIMGTAVAAVLAVGGTKVIMGQMSLGTLVAFNTYLAMLAGPIRMFGRILNMISRASASCERIFEVLDAKSEIKDLPDAIEFAHGRGEVEFIRVSFSHTDERQVLQDISFRVEPGQLVAVVGPTGSGKSTLVNLIPRFYETTSGCVKVDGRDVKEYSLHSLRVNIGVVMQDTFLFSARIAENIAYGRPQASLQEIRNAAQGASIGTFVEHQPSGYETVIGERGMGLSGGQKQRLALARALVLKPAILILDDTTSNVDTETEQAILNSLAALRGTTTVFVVAQRFSLVKQADQIFVLEQGRLVERGTHAELMANHGLYRSMAEMQLE